MKTIWIIILLVILVRSIMRRMERTGPAGQYEEPVETAGHDLEEPPLERVPGDGERRKLNLPDYITGRGGRTPAPVEEGEPRRAAENAAMGRRPLKVERPERRTGRVNLEPKDFRPLSESPPAQAGASIPRGRPRQRAVGDDSFIDITGGPGQVLKGIVWAEILGPRGGIQARRRK